MTDTIFALGTGAGRAAIAIIRLTGPDTCATLEAFCKRRFQPRNMERVTIRSPETSETIDFGLAHFSPGPGSPTGEAYAEFQIHGGRASVDALLAALSARPGLRAAEPGEFTRRAFANGKVDLSQVEALADLIDAQTEFQRRQAVRVANGALRHEVAFWREQIVRAMALVESQLDFSDEGDVGAFDQEQLAASIDPLIGSISRALSGAPQSERMRDGFHVAIVGPPNAGKSTLMNALVGRDMAIVSPIAGTTRDTIEAHLDLKGAPVTLVDTAGLRDTFDEVERIGVGRTYRRLEEADLILWLSDTAEPPGGALDAEVLGKVLLIGTKGDIAHPPVGWLAVSAETGEGVNALIDILAERARQFLGDGTSSLLVRTRQRAHVNEAREALTKALKRDQSLELVAQDLREAANALGKIVGAVGVEEVLDEIFSRFCIGK